MDQEITAMTVTRRTVLAAGAVAAAAAATTSLTSRSPAHADEPDSFPLRLPDMPLHDPYIVPDEASGMYYLYSYNDWDTTGVREVGTMVYRSRNLRDWAEPVVVFRTNPGMWATDGAWAPEVHRYRGRYYLFTTLHNESREIPVPPPNQWGMPVQMRNYMRGTIIAVSDSLLGPFEPVDPTRPVAPENFMTLDGTLYEDLDGRPWMVYAHEWLQKIEGTMEAVPLKPDLSGADGDPVFLFKASDASWISAEMPAPSTNQITPYVTDGPQLYRAPSGALIMLWSTYEKNVNGGGGTVDGHYVQTYAVSHSGNFSGPWAQREPLLRQDSGHGMIFNTLDRPSRPMLIVHRPFDNARGKLYEIDFRGSQLHLGRQRTDLDGDQ
ncbi:MAG TPA: glycoside hydrolase family 43 protein [Microbacterium sp.]|nr:glycoside hydrolase family 43 protein [Microbacterium sp.]